MIKYLEMYSVDDLNFFKLNGFVENLKHIHKFNVHTIIYHFKYECCSKILEYLYLQFSTIS